MNLLDYVLNNDEMMDEKTAETLIISRISASVKEVTEAMEGIMTPFQKMMMKQVLTHLHELSERIEEMDIIIDTYMAEYWGAIKKLEQIPGVGKKSAEIILAEIGLDMNQFPTAGHLASWAGVAPGNNESAGKRKSGRTRKGNKILKSTLAQAAKSAAKNKNSFFHAQYQRIAIRRGKNRATLAVAHSILIAISPMIVFIPTRMTFITPAPSTTTAPLNIDEASTKVSPVTSVANSSTETEKCFKLKLMTW